jgi:splicing suppressor protein 51
MQYRCIGDVSLHFIQRFEHGDNLSVMSPVSMARTEDQYQPLSYYAGWKKFVNEVPMSTAINELYDPQFTPWLATDSSTITVSIVAALELSSNKLRDRFELWIHIVGATTREVDRHLLFEDLLHLLPALERLYVVMIGPETVEPQRPDYLSFDRMNICPKCVARGRQYNLRLVQAKYHIYAQTNAYRRPDLAVLFHSGRTQSAIMSWRPTIRLLVDWGTLTLCTTRTMIEAKEEVRELDDLDANVVLRPEENPWRGLVPVPELLDGEEHSFWYHNNIRYMFKGRKDAKRRAKAAVSATGE